MADHSGEAERSQSSQTPSPSHSASATAFSASDDLDGIRARDEEVETGDDDEKEDDDSMRTFTSAGLEASDGDWSDNGMSTKTPEPENLAAFQIEQCSEASGAVVAGRSRSSQTPSPSHSASPASFSVSDIVALRYARDEEDESGDDDEKEDYDSIGTFASAHLKTSDGDGSGNASITKPPENLAMVKIELSSETSGAVAAGWSRSSQTPSPSHSASASTAAFFVSDIGAFTPNDDLDSVSTRDEEDETADNDEKEDNDSMNTFTTEAFDDAGSGNARSTKLPKLRNQATAEIEPSSEISAKDDPGTTGDDVQQNSVAPVILMPGIPVKENPGKGIFTGNIQTSGLYSAREEGLKREEESGKLKILCFANDGVDEHMIWLIGLKNIFARQLPNMPKVYIVRLVMDRSHKSMMVIRQNRVVGGITYCPYISQRFGEILFCAITSDEQMKGYGTRLMNHLKQHARDVDGLTHLLTYTDKNAVGYFIKQGFTKEIHLDKEIWQGYIKEYDGGILMECKINPNLPYTDLPTMIQLQRQAIDEKINELSNCHVVHPGIDFQKKEAGISGKLIKVEDIPGLREAGWTPDQWGHSRFKALNATDSVGYGQQLNSFMRNLLKMMNELPDAWPFREPVDARDVPDYYDIIKDPVDLKTMSKRLESEQYYVTFEMFVADVKRMCANARTYNTPETIYYKCSIRLQNFFSNKVQALLQSSTKS